MAPRRVLITGAAGFVGRHLLATLRHALPQAELFATGTAPSGLHAPAGFHPLDVTEPGAAAALMRRLRPDACVHLAAVAAIPAARRDPDLAWRVNLGGTLALARAILDAAPDCRLLFVSSADCYGASFRPGQALDEDAALAPLNTYAATKAAADLALGALAAEGLRVLRLRPFNHTGPGQSADFVVAAFARQLALIGAGRQAPCLQVGALTPQRDFLDVRDVCAAYAACLVAPQALWEGGQVLNLASGTARRIGDVLDDLLALSGVQAEVAAAAPLLRPTDVALARGVAGRARTWLGWQPRIGWEQTLRDVLADWRGRVRMGTDNMGLDKAGMAAAPLPARALTP